ncbi:hypothetical protein [Rhodopseudomonas faecalis]|uniref:hypothetical protein n=1 Tax=Rhodopseudomonas faecalis TaxID=99655 RepID=UPI0015E8A57A|nr:hypothetical protein [Rhodopseudomonas faecalis]
MTGSIDPVGRRPWRRPIGRPGAGDIVTESSVAIVEYAGYRPKTPPLRSVWANSA